MYGWRNLGYYIFSYNFPDLNSSDYNKWAQAEGGTRWMCEFPCGMPTLVSQLYLVTVKQSKTQQEGLSVYNCNPSHSLQTTTASFV